MFRAVCLLGLKIGSGGCQMLHDREKGLLYMELVEVLIRFGRLADRLEMQNEKISVR